MHGRQSACLLADSLDGGTSLCDGNSCNCNNISISLCIYLILNACVYIYVSEYMGMHHVF